MTSKPKICFVVNTDWFVKALLGDQFRALSERYDLVLLGNFTNDEISVSDAFPGKVVSIPIARELAPVRDLYALAALVRLFVKERFAAVHSLQPKAGLLTMVAAWLTRVPIRIHTMTGQVWVTRSGPMRQILKAMDRTLAWCATHMLTDSPSQRDFLIEQRIAAPGKVRVLGDGSVSGVDTARFKPSALDRQRVRSELGISDDAIMLLFVGRLSRDKGVGDLAKAFAELSVRHPKLALILVGPDEDGLRAAIEGAGAPTGIRFVDYTPYPERFMAAADIFCLPSYREGFGTVIIEAAAVGVPSVASRIYGVIDAVEEGVTGLLHQAGSVADLSKTLEVLITSPELRQTMGLKARARVEAQFSRNRLTEALIAYYEERLRVDTERSLRVRN